MNYPALEFLHADQENTQKFLSDAIALFSGQRGGHIGKWLYSDTQQKYGDLTGARLWTKISEEMPDHAVASGEELAIDAYVQKCDGRNDFKHIQNFIEFGPGTEHAARHKAGRLVGLATSAQSYTGIRSPYGISMNIS